MPARRFAKYHGLGNDFIIFDLREGNPPGSLRDPSVATALCDRRVGIGADGVLLILPPTRADSDARMLILNSDGSEAEMCGNGLRCVAKFLHDRDPAHQKGILRIETGAGLLTCGLTTGENGRAATISVEMGKPRLARGEIPMIGPESERCLDEAIPLMGESLRVTTVSMGNPHAVAFVNERGADLRALAERVGRSVEIHPWFPHRTNVELAHVVSPTEIELVVWERGCGITLACGTGACATAVAACLTERGKTGQPISVRLLGGSLSIAVAHDYSGVTMSGPAAHVYDGEVDPAATIR
ncbi:MAG: diaminopimelate epimerase [Deltaproteobacteria bacterium]|nr:diaminopimelate epimerase [Deltaproteobacteria bacterium]